MRQVEVTRSTQKETGAVYYYNVHLEAFKVDTVTGSFHQFAQAGEGGCMSVVAVVELDDGSIVTPVTEAVRFIKEAPVAPVAAGEPEDY